MTRLRCAVLGMVAIALLLTGCSSGDDKTRQR